MVSTARTRGLHDAAPHGQQNFGILEMALATGQSQRTITLELQRIAQQMGYARGASRAFVQKRRRQTRSLGKLHRSGVLFDVVRHFSCERWLPRTDCPDTGPHLLKGH